MKSSLRDFLTSNTSTKFQFYKFCYNNLAQLSEAQYNELESNLQLQYKVTSSTDLIKLEYYDNWLVGFIEAEACFSIRANGNHSFTINHPKGD